MDALARLREYAGDGTCLGYDVAEVLDELDDLRREVERLKVELDLLSDAAERLKVEREDARAEVERLRARGAHMA